VLFGNAVGIFLRVTTGFGSLTESNTIVGN
jgi:hypothetical protein